MDFFGYIFWPNPGSPVGGYANTKVMALLLLGIALIALSFGVRYWRARLQNPVTKKLSRSWGMAALWFGIVALLLTVSRVEEIQFLAMRFLWLLWFLVLALYIALQIRIFRTRHYEVLPKEQVVDPRNRYLPGKSRR